ncbi:putative had-like protein [Botryosphaeria dothidea]|uniref:Had-like protein n=1 Tax=Botryosphaeria dothidea TaxID=55169 RepID=A0A8H4J3K2_9PEZI|nr:putative had-like protein [Botryosphaeria dothidea]
MIHELAGAELAAIVTEDEKLGWSIAATGGPDGATKHPEGQFLGASLPAKGPLLPRVPQRNRYYHQPDVYLYFFAGLLVGSPNSDVFRSTAALLHERLSERINSPTDALGLGLRGLGMHVLACHYMGSAMRSTSSSS